MSIEYSMQQLGLLLPTAALTVNGGWPQRCWRAMADRDENMHGPLVKTTDGNARRNPLIKSAADAAEDRSVLRASLA